jgi:peptidoglycan/LPS O-acetylase OafA/YrhL
MPQRAGIPFSRRGLRRNLAQIAIGCLLAVACAYVLGMMGVEVPGLDLMIVFVLGMVLVIWALKPWNRHRVGRIQ